MQAQRELYTRGELTGTDKSERAQVDAEAKKQARGEINENDRTDVMAAGGRYPRPALELDNSYLYRNTACSSHRGVLKCF